MEQTEGFKDWLFRYQYVYRLRRTEKSKKRFLAALVTDIAKMREDVRVIEYNQQKKYAARNVYVGNIKQADRVICTFYDTPPESFGSYQLFDRKDQAKKTTRFILASTIVAILLGIIGTLIYMRLSPNSFQLNSIGTFGIVAIYAAYFALLGKVTKGLSNRKTLVRNTSSILAMLKMIAENKQKNIAYAFLDEGSYGNKGLDELQDQVKNHCKIYYLDSVGASAPLHLIGESPNSSKINSNVDYQAADQKVSYLFSARKDQEHAGFYLNPADLKEKQLNMENIATVTSLFQ
ncbi:hypothetical protein P7D85_15960 [Enterococcus hulanensis]|uniref:Uncharacterized protein n=1 Tax=Enterococcus hulanensis TaxID=2559929 RepID=A0ABU3F2C3_9ENTE|nr:hypothetical protein [Enterococcus hulanensis]MDT2601283.1 hypothetical protein [Enterococcus hulanensis]MDT2610807.1 hypothetical protein [Enterococcus hulanensis]MDT2618212.1 hypothetical protein [Enterococcus hulanensis]MDT2629218.1 hypothetical protein [Enterococcus hulanensis]MDT2656777.1 hypothetical protein [Enterococcus hulanensis]